MKLMQLTEINGVYADAYLTDESNKLIFLSVWGRDTALQEFIARLQMPKAENGIRDFHILSEKIRQFVTVPNVDDLEKTTIKTPDTILGVMTQMWIYDRLAVKPDNTNHRALMLYRTQDKRPDLWPVVKSVCPLPLLDHWQDIFLAMCFDKQWIKMLEHGSGMSGLYVHLGDDLDQVVSDMIRNVQLTLPNAA